jgi:hypothetical protein
MGGARKINIGQSTTIFFRTKESLRSTIFSFMSKVTRIRQQNHPVG